MAAPGDVIGEAGAELVEPALFLGGTLAIWVTSCRQALRALAVAPAVPALADQPAPVPLPPPDRCPGCGRPYLIARS